ncbi:MAG: DUF2341 domain-containing protein [Promethearchaeota archaeon]
MIGKRNIKKRRYFLCILLIFIFNLFSIILLSGGSIREDGYGNLNADLDSQLNISSNNPPSKNEFNYYKEIIIDHSKVSGSTPLFDFPFLISIYDSDLHDSVQSSGNDIAFSDGITWLDHEIEVFERDYNASHARLVVWVRLPSLSTITDTKIYLYYGNTTMGPSESPSGVWDANYKGVWHASENPTGTIYDSTSNNNDGTPQGSMSSADQVDGQIGGSLNFDGNDEFIDCGNPTSLQITGSITVETWFKADYFGNTYLISKNGPSHERGWDVSFDDINSTHGYLIYRYALNGEVHADDVGNITVPINQWHHVVGVFESSSYSRLFLNGEMVDENTTDILSSQYDGPNPVRFAARGDSIPPNYYNGIIDEIRISNIARSADWISTEYENQFDPNSCYSIGEEHEVSDLLPNVDYFTWYKEIIIDHTMVSGPDELLNFPVLISCFDEDLHDKVQADGNDIAFSNGMAWLDHEIELFDQTYNSTHAQLVAWIRVPNLSSSEDTILYMYYGNSTMGSRENPVGVWDETYEFVLHMNQDPSSSDILDSTLNEFDFDVEALGSMTSDDLVIGQTGKALAFDGVDDYIFLPFSEGFSGPIDKMNFEFWLMLPDGGPPPSRDYLGAPASASGHPYLSFYDDSFEFKIATVEPDSEVLNSAQTTFNAGTWYHFSAVWDGTGAGLHRIYIDGSLDSEDFSVKLGNHVAWNTFSIGAEDDDVNGPGGSGGDRQLKATVSEFRLSKVVRSADWIATEYNNQYDPNSFYLIGPEYTVSGIPPNEHNFKYYKEITIDQSMISGAHDLLNFPLLISIFDDDLHDKVQPDGDDIAFAYMGAWLDHEIELFNQTFNSTHAQLISWVSLPRLSTSSDTIIRIYYGNATMSNQQNPTAVWGYKYRGVWHLSEYSGNSKDSTTHGTEGIPSTGVTLGASGLIGYAYDFNGVSGTKLDYGDPIDDHLDVGTSSFTISVWVNYDQNTGTFQMPLYKGGTSNGNEGYALEMNNGLSSAFYVSNGTQASAVGWATITLDSWTFLVGVVNRITGKMSLYKDGSIINEINVVLGNLSSDENLKVSNNVYPVDGIVDEPRICGVARSADWIATEYNNQYNPQFFLTLSEEVSFDITPPTYSNLTESSDPLELGDTEIITINVSDPSGINKVDIEFEGDNYSMTNIGGDIWQYDSWTPSNVDNYTYTIWMEDNYYNWNSTTGNIEVIDTTAPTYSDLIESADPLQLGQNETINIKVYDSPGSGVNQVLLEYDSSNHTMVFIGGNTWSWSKWKPISSGSHSYTIYMQDMENNWNMTSETIEVVSTTAPVIENLTKSPETLELGNNITIFVDVDDNETFVSTVLIELENVNYTMSSPVGTTYNFTWTRSWAGTIIFKIYANDSVGNWNSLTNSFDIVDTTAPTFSSLIDSDPLEFGETAIISVNSTDLSDIIQAEIEYQDLDSIIRNHTMSNIIGDLWQYNLWTPHTTGNWSYTIWAMDNNSNWGSVNDSIFVRDTILPRYSDLIESESVVELGELLTISINATDLAGISEVVIEFENSNSTMTNIGGDIWQYNSWGPSSIGNYTYTIYITDMNNNLNFTSGSIQFQDTIIPTYSNFFESVDPLELGDPLIIRIDAYDYAGVIQVLLEFEGTNHSMVNIYGDTWQYDSWIPTNWILYQYKIYMEDLSGNWNSIMTNITVQDTTPPPAPALTNSPSGDVSGTLVFDWLDGSDPSGISYYILIIDNETNPLTTPGYVYFFNITNVGPESSYYVLLQTPAIGDYFYFLAQIDGVGHQSSYTMGSFTIIQSGNGGANNNLLIIVIILASVIGSAIAIVVVRKRAKKDMKPPRKKISFKTILSHIDKLSSISSAFQAVDVQGIKKLPDEKEIETRVNEIKNLGEELFNEGAYLEAHKQFKLGKDFLMNLGREEDAKIFSDLIAGIEGLIEERDKRLEYLDQLKRDGESVQIFDLYQDLSDISQKLRDPDSASFYQFELIDYFQKNSLELVNLENYRNELNQRAESSFSNGLFKAAATLFDKCERISQLFVQLEREEEIAKLEEFRDKKNECLNKINNE